MSREYDAQSKVPNEAYRDNFDRIFGKKKPEPEVQKQDFPVNPDKFLERKGP